MKVEMDVLGSSPLTVLTVSVDVKATLNSNSPTLRARSCVKVEVDVLGSSPLTVLTVSVDVKQH